MRPVKIYWKGRGILSIRRNKNHGALTNIATSPFSFTVTIFTADESDDEDERPSRRRRIAERAAEGAEDEEVNFQFL